MTSAASVTFEIADAVAVSVTLAITLDAAVVGGEEDEEDVGELPFVVGCEFARSCSLRHAAE
jgi:hypothetical protein